MSGVSNTRRLRQILLGAKTDQRFTLDQIVARSEGRVRRSYANNLTKELYRRHPLTREELTDIAEAFGVDFETLLQAHLRDMGLAPVEGISNAPAIALDLPRGIERLTARQRAALVTLIRAMIDPGDEPGFDVPTEEQVDAAADASLEAAERAEEPSPRVTSSVPRSRKRPPK